jgi:hypothetical protein
MGSGVGYRDIAMLLLGMALAVARPLGANEATPGMTTVHAATQWYRARPEAEQEFAGFLRLRDREAGPGGRPALRYELERPDGGAAVYDPQSSRVLAELAGRPVIIRGKMVDLGEGFGRELWIGAIASAP